MTVRDARYVAATPHPPKVSRPLPGVSSCQVVTGCVSGVVLCCHLRGGIIVELTYNVMCLELQLRGILQLFNQLHVFLARGEPKKGSHSQTTFGGS
jgi:hypothetical protein